MTNSDKVIAQLASKFGTAVRGQFEAIRFQYYDYVGLSNVAAGTNRLTFFSNPIGAVDPVLNRSKTLEETNIRRSGELDERFAIMQVRTAIYVPPAGSVATASGRQTTGMNTVNNLVVQATTPLQRIIANLNFQGVLSVNFGQKNFIQIEQPFQTCPPGYGPSIRTISASDTATASTTQPSSQYTSQSVDPRDVYVMDPAIFVEKGQTFSANIDFYMRNTPSIVSSVGGNTSSPNTTYTPNVLVGLIFDGYVIRPVQ